MQGRHILCEKQGKINEAYKKLQDGWLSNGDKVPPAEFARYAFSGLEAIHEVRGIQREGNEDVESGQRKDAKQTGALDFISRKHSLLMASICLTHCSIKWFRESGQDGREEHQSTLRNLLGEISFPFILHGGAELPFCIVALIEIAKCVGAWVGLIINRANENQEDPLAFSARFCKEFMIDTMMDLQCLTPTEQPSVSGHNTNDAFKCSLRKDQMYCFKGFIGSLAL
ncbi:hypothetical protein CTI12_AA294600 [Artemisia annua]|uniref:peptidylprolyl isomerase n=1 Tax=Artemisia annua TaxID=35608 RepID=A0A2U1N830_ARTAN|nr:hypothetical protein CTI12_AA294600 [Artemisia annua]